MAKKKQKFPITAWLAAIMILLLCVLFELIWMRSQQNERLLAELESAAALETVMTETVEQTTQPETEAPDVNAPWYEQTTYIAHGMGGIDGITYTNSLEAFEKNYAAGFRVFEVDFAETTDGVLVARHKWTSNGYDSYSKKNIPTADEYLNNPIFGKYTALSFENVIELAVQYPDVYFITDTKKVKNKDNKRIFKNIVALAEDMGYLDVVQKQFIVQIYNEKMYHTVTELLHPENVLFTLYRLEEEECPDATVFCGENNIPVVTYSRAKWSAELQALAESYGLTTAVNTFNDADETQAYKDRGVSLFYTDFLTPIDARED